MSSISFRDFPASHFLPESHLEPKNPTGFYFKNHPPTPAPKSLMIVVEAWPVCPRSQEIRIRKVWCFTLCAKYFITPWMIPGNNGHSLERCMSSSVRPSKSKQPQEDTRPTRCFSVAAGLSNKQSYKFQAPKMEVVPLKAIIFLGRFPCIAP